jgi:hypothetical protein
MPTSVKGGHLHDSKVFVSERHVGGRRMVVTACSECGEVHEERPARTGEGRALDPLADVI